MTRLYRVLYCSRNCIPGSPDAVEAHVRAILAASRTNNARDGITGGLLFSNGYFAQVLEGPVTAVEAAFERIQCDERHSDVTVLQAGPIAVREFPDWSMAFAGTAGAGELPDGIVLADAVSDRSTTCDEILGLLKAVVVRETDWHAPPPELACVPAASLAQEATCA